MHETKRKEEEHNCKGKYRSQEKKIIKIEHTVSKRKMRERNYTKRKKTRKKANIATC